MTNLQDAEGFGSILSNVLDALPFLTTLAQANTASFFQPNINSQLTHHTEKPSIYLYVYT